MIHIGLLPDDQAHVDNAARCIQGLLANLKLAEITFEQFMVASLDPNSICYQVMQLNVTNVTEEDITVNWNIPHERNIRYLIDSISMRIYDRLNDAGPAIRRLWADVFLLEAFKFHPAQLVIMAAPHHTPYSLILGEQYSYWEPMEEDTFFIVDDSVNISETLEENETRRLQPFIEIFNQWDSIERELMVKMLNKTLRCKTLVELLTTIRDSVCLKWTQNKIKLNGNYRSENLVFAITFTTIKNII